MKFSNRILVPLASEDDAKRTCAAITESLGDDVDPPTFILVHVIEKDGGGMDKAPLPAREEDAQEIFDLATTLLENSRFDVESELLYGTNVVETLIDSIETLDAGSLLFLPRSQGRLSRLLTGNLSTKLLVNSPVPVITLPQPNGS